VLITPDFVFLHMPKTGGGTVTHVVKAALPKGTVRAGPGGFRHPGRSCIPETAEHLPVLCFVRNPWDWYVSWYWFSRRANRPTALWRSVFGDDPDFPSFIRRVCAGDLEHDRPEIARLLRAGTDFYTARFRALVGDDLDYPQLTCARFERLNVDLEEFLRGAAAPIPDDFGNLFQSTPVVHPGSRGPYQEYYDDETREVVARACFLFTDRFGYRF
jgi:hypothetical protein